MLGTYAADSDLPENMAMNQDSGDELLCFGMAPTILGTENNDVLQGTKGADVIMGLRGNDQIYGNDGDDLLCGGPGIDRISGGQGQDFIFGGRGSDFISGDDGDDKLWGGTGWDFLMGGDGDDRVVGAKGNDNLSGNSGKDNLDGQEGNDVLDGIPDDEDPVIGDIFVTVSDIRPDPGDDIEISGAIDGADEDDDVHIAIREPNGGSFGDADTQVDDDGDFSEVIEISEPADDGIYQIEVEFGSEDPAFAYFLIDDEADEAPTETDADVYEPGDTVEIVGEVEDPETGIDEVSIAVLTPEGEDLGDDDIELDSDEFSLEVDLDSSAHAGVYAVIVEYDDEEVGWAIFEVEEGGGSGGSGDITATITDTTLAPGDEVEITGSIDEDDLELGIEVILAVEGPDGDEIDEYGDVVEPESNGEFEFNFDLETDADTGSYAVTLSYELLDDKELAFTVSSSSGGGSGGSGSGSDSGLTARLSKTSVLAGETITVSGVVPEITSEEQVGIVILKPNGAFLGVSAFPEPKPDKSYSATLRVPLTADEGEDYEVVVGYDNNEVRLGFDITGKSSGGAGSTLTVKADKTTYAAGSTVILSGEIEEGELVPGNQIVLRVYNPNNEPYRIDPISPESGGSYSYALVVGGPLGVPGEWNVTVSYRGSSAETTFELS
jgi:hypothetical protein